MPGRYCHEKKCELGPLDIYVMVAKYLSNELKPGKVSKSCEGIPFMLI